jgi:hypothetical protein
MRPARQLNYLLKIIRQTKSIKKNKTTHMSGWLRCISRAAVLKRLTLLLAGPAYWHYSKAMFILNLYSMLSQ